MPGPVDIVSSTNSRFKTWKTLLGSKGIKQHHLAIVSGSKLVHEIIRLKPGIVEGCLSTLKGEPDPELVAGRPWFRLKNGLFRELDVHGTGYPLLLVKIPDIPDCDSRTFDNAMTLLIPFQDPGNVGAVIRSAAAFGMDKIVLLSEAALPFHPKSIRAGGTSVFQVAYRKGPSISRLDTVPVPIVGLSSDGVPVYDFTFPEHCALLPGLEGPGLPNSVNTDFTVSIPIEPHVESLNAAVAVSIALYEYRRKMAGRV